MQAHLCRDQRAAANARSGACSGRQRRSTGSHSGQEVKPPRRTADAAFLTYASMRCLTSDLHCPAG